VSAICWCGVKIWIRTGVTKTVVLLLNNLNGIKKPVEDISVDAELGCNFCSVVIYDAKYSIKKLYNSDYIKLTLSPMSKLRNQLGSSSTHLMHIISVNMSVVSHCQVGGKQEWNDNRNYIILQFSTLPTCNCFCENFSAFNKTYIYIRQRYKKCMLWRFIAWYMQNSAR
jgi:hypothetical protein